jgi:hypothetical protein
MVAAVDMQVKAITVDPKLLLPWLNNGKYKDG